MNYSSRMTLRSIYIVRHGYRSDWLGYPVKPPTGFMCDPLLAPHGVDQAKCLGQFFKNEAEPKPQIVFASPFFRCVETGYPTSQALHIPIFLEKGVGEWFKPHKGVPKCPTYDSLKPFFSTLSDEWDWETVVPSLEGEDENDIYERCKHFWVEFIPKVERLYPEVELVLLVSHAATKIALGMALLGYNDTHELLKPEHRAGGLETRIDASTCSLDSYVLDSANKKWSVQYTGNTSFLPAGKEMKWHFATLRFVAGLKEELEERKKREQSSCGL